MKKFIGMLFGALMVMVGVFFSCDKSREDLQVENVAFSEIKNDKISLSSFPFAKVFSNQELEERVSKTSLGSSRQASIVPLIFNEEGVLYDGASMTPTVKSQNQKIYYTDFETYVRVASQHEKYSQYAKKISMYGKNLYFFDPYQSKYDEIPTSVQTRSLYSRGNLLKILLSKVNIADIFYESSTVLSQYTGHVAGVNNVSIYSTKPVSVLDAMDAITVTEAFFPWVYTRSMKQWWKHTNTITLLQYKKSISQSQRKQIADFWLNQTGKPYNVTTLWDDDYWYCSKLMWRGYYDVLGVDIDNDGGYFCFPDDILNSRYFSTTVYSQ